MKKTYNSSGGGGWQGSSLPSSSSRMLSPSPIFLRLSVGYIIRFHTTSTRRAGTTPEPADATPTMSACASSRVRAHLRTPRTAGRGHAAYSLRPAATTSRVRVLLTLKPAAGAVARALCVSVDTVHRYCTDGRLVKTEEKGFITRRSWDEFCNERLCASGGSNTNCSRGVNNSGLASPATGKSRTGVPDARQAHTLEVVGSTPTSATRFSRGNDIGPRARPPRCAAVTRQRGPTTTRGNYV